MATLKVEVQKDVIKTGAAKVPVTLRRLEGGAATATVIICNPVPLAGDAAHHLIESIVDALVEERVAIATYEPACEGLILEDFDKYSAQDSVDEFATVVKHVITKQESDSPLVLLGYGAGAIIAATVAGEMTTSSLCLLNPLLPADVTSWRNQANADHAERSHIPAKFADTIGTIDPLNALGQFKVSMLVLNGASDRTARADSAEQYITAARSAGHRAAHLLIACGDHALTDSLARQAAIEKIVQFVKSRG